MKLTDITEGTFGDLVSLAAAKIGSKPEDRLVVKTDQRLFELVRRARQFTFHLFDRRALSWWKEVFDYFKIPTQVRKEVLIAARSEFYGRLDHSLFEADFSKLIDLLNPRTRASTAKLTARAATNEKLATAIIGYVARAAGNITPTQRKERKEEDKTESPPPGSRPKVKRWKKKPDNAIIQKAMAVAKRALHSSGDIRRVHLKQLDDMGFRIDWDVDPPKLRVKH